MIEPHIKPDAPGTQPGDVGNGHVLVIDKDTQKFNGVVYHRKDENGYYYTHAKGKPLALHKTVWTYHNGAPPKGYHIHHEYRKPDGSFDKSENNIEWLRLMTSADHRLYHKFNDPPLMKECEVCHKIYEAAAPGQKYCSPKCTRKAANEKLRIQKAATTIYGVKDSELAFSDTSTDVVECGLDDHGNVPETRICVFCKKPFIARASRNSIACQDRNCQALLMAVRLADKRIERNQFIRNCGVASEEVLKRCLPEYEIQFIHKLIFECHNLNVEAAHDLLDEFFYRRLKDKI